MADNKLAPVPSHHVRAILDELRSDVDTAFSDLESNPSSQSGRRRVINAAVAYLETARTLLDLVAQSRCMKQPINFYEREAFAIPKLERDEVAEPGGPAAPSSWERSLSRTLLSAARISRLDPQGFSPGHNISDALVNLASTRARLLEPSTLSSLDITKHELQNASTIVTWVHVKAHQLLTVASESPAQELKRRLKLRELYDLRHSECRHRQTVFCSRILDTLRRSLESEPSRHFFHKLLVDNFAYVKFRNPNQINPNESGPFPGGSPEYLAPIFHASGIGRIAYLSTLPGDVSALSSKGYRNSGSGNDGSCEGLQIWPRVRSVARSRARADRLRWQGRAARNKQAW
jgi:hypothetical protein